MCHRLGVEPYAHAVCASHTAHLADSLDTLDLWCDVDVYVVGYERLVERVVGAVDADHGQGADLSLLDRYTDLRDFARQLALGLRNLVLHVHRGLVRVGALFEIDVDAGRSRRCTRLHVCHAFDTVDCLLERNDYGFLYCLGACPHIGRRDMHGRWRDVRELLDRQRRQRKYSEEYDSYGDTDGQ